MVGADSFSAYDVVVDCARGGGLTHDAFACVAEGRGGARDAREARAGSGASGTSTSSRWACGAREAVVREVWAARVARNPKLYNGTKFRLKRCELADDAGGEVVVRARLELTDYKTFLGTNLADDWFALATDSSSRDGRRGDDDDASNEIVARASSCGRVVVRDDSHRNRRFADALGNCVCLRAADGRFLALHRSDDVGEAPGALVFPGGHAEPKAVGFDDATHGSMDVSEYMFRSASDELREELGIHPHHVSPLRCLGVTRRVVNARSCMVFYATTDLTSEEILRDHYPRAEDGFESARAAALDIDELLARRDTMPGCHVGALELLRRCLETANERAS